MKKLRKLRENKKGFTLVEVIVVLVIIAILAALLIPSLTGYIKKAENSAAIAEARTVLVALQTEASESKWKSWTDTELSTDQATEVQQLAELTISDATVYDIDINANGKITAFVYKNATKTVTYAETPAAGADKFTVAD